MRALFPRTRLKRLKKMTKNIRIVVKNQAETRVSREDNHNTTMLQIMQTTMYRTCEPQIQLLFSSNAFRFIGNTRELTFDITRKNSPVYILVHYNRSNKRRSFYFTVLIPVPCSI